jgi:CRISPR-associated protein Cas1
MGSERLGVVAKMDLVETKAEKDDLFTALEVCPVDYKAGAPKEGEEANELWDTDKMQLGLQALILRDNGYTCNEGVIYYRATKQRVRLPITPELENWILQNIAEARAGRYRADSGAAGPFAEVRALFTRASLSAGRNTNAGANSCGD